MANSTTRKSFRICSGGHTPSGPGIFFLLQKRKNLRVFLQLTFSAVCSFLSVGAVCAQTTVGLQEAVAIALKNNPSIQSSEYSHQARLALKKTSFDWGKTSLVLLRGQYNSLNTDNNFTLTQSIPFPIVSAKEVKLNRALATGSEKMVRINENELAYQVKQSYTRLQYVIALHQLLQKQDTLYAKFANAASVRYKTGETNLLEKTTAETQRMEVQNQLRQNERDVEIESVHLQNLLFVDQLAIPSDQLVPFDVSEKWNPEEIDRNPQLQYWKTQTNVSVAEKQLQRSRFLPDLTIGYFNQSLIGFQRMGDTETFYDKSKRFTGWTFGVALPIWFLPQAGRSQAARLNQYAAEKNYESFQRQLSGQFDQAIKELEKNQNNLSYYQKDASPHAVLLLTQSQRAYDSGEIGYTEYLQALKNAYAIEANYLLAIYSYNLSVLHLNYLLGEK